MNSALVRDVRQFFSHGVLAQFQRIEEAGVSYTFDPADIYLSSYAEALEYLEASPFTENDEQLAQYARVFENYLADPFDCVNKRSAAVMASSLYYLSGHSANALVIACNLCDTEPAESPSSILLKLLRRDFAPLFADHMTPITYFLGQYVRDGDEAAFERTIVECKRLKEHAFTDGMASEFVASVLLERVLDRFHYISLWSSIHGKHTAPVDAWKKYVGVHSRGSMPVMDLWPSQRKAVNSGLLDGSSSLVLQMPTSAGKTKLTELAFVNDLASDDNRKCLYLAPFRALASEVEKQIGGTLSALGYPVASLYGNAEANELDVELANAARVIIATPEKASAVLKLSGGSLADFETIVLDEGHLIDSRNRGTAFELQLSHLRRQLLREGTTGRSIFLSAVLPNASEIAEWLGGTADALISSDWQPTFYRIAIARWSAGNQPRLEYTATDRAMLTEQFFVPRILDQEEWRERNPTTNRMNTHRFPVRNNSSSLAAALAVKFLEAGPVIVYAAQRAWTESIAQSLLGRLNTARPLESGLITNDNTDNVKALADYMDHLLGAESVMARSVRNGFAIHHGRIPHAVRVIIEDEFRNQTLRLLICTNTLAQGVNLPARTVILHSLPRTDAPRRDFWNLLGRAGRATKETAGEIIVIDSGNVNAETLRGFLRRENMERAWSSILIFVAEMLENNVPIDTNNVSEVVKEPDSEWRSCIRAIDMSILEVLAESEADADIDESLDSLVGSLLAIRQAESLGERNPQQSELLLGGIRQLFQVRKTHVSELASTKELQHRFAKAGISVESCVTIDDAVETLLPAIRPSEGFSDEIFSQIINLICQTEEVNRTDPELVLEVGRAWMAEATYADIYSNHQDVFDDLDTAMYFVEDVICYKVPWVINAMVRIFETPTDDAVQVDLLPAWFRLLPAMLQYGVQTEQLVWIMSLGVSDRMFARWLLEAYSRDSGRSLSRSRDFIQWAIDTRGNLINEISEAWPSYFTRLYSGVLDRYERILEVL